MRSIKTVYKIGQGPSSSHTVGPFRAAKWFKEQHPEADAFEVTLFGSLAFTGEGHGTEKAIRRILPDAAVRFDLETQDLPHPNTMLFRAFRGGELLGERRIFSIGGGSIRWEGGIHHEEDREIYPQKTFGEMLYYCLQEGISLKEFIYRTEGPSLTPYLSTVWAAMKEAVERGLATEGELPGGLLADRGIRGEVVHIDDRAAASADEMGMGLGAGVEPLEAVHHAHADDLAPGAELGQIAVDRGPGDAAFAELVADPGRGGMRFGCAQAREDLVALDAVSLGDTHFPQPPLLVRLNPTFISYRIRREK